MNNSQMIYKVIKIIKLIEDERLAPMTYKKLNELGVTKSQRKNWTQEQANSYIQNHKKKVNKTKKTKLATPAKNIKLKSYKHEFIYNNKSDKVLNGRNKDGSLYERKNKFDYKKADFEPSDIKYDKTVNGTLGRYTDEKGNFTKERQALHNQIIDTYFVDKKKSKDPTYMFLGGGAASGKSTTLKQLKANGDFLDESDTVTVDCDGIKERLPEFEKKNPSRTHEESSAVAKQIKSIAIDNDINVVDDGTGDGSVQSMLKKIKAAKAKGMKVKARYITTDIENAIKWNAKRSRSVKPATVYQTHRKVAEILPQIAKYFDDVELWYNAPNKESVLIAKGGSGKDLTATKNNNELYKKFLDKKDLKYNEDLK